MKMTRIAAAAAIALVLTSSGRAADTAPANAGASPQKTVEHHPAVISAGALKTGMLAVTRAGARIVAVGDRGVVLLSDDDGATFHQSKVVPTRATLTSVVFLADGKTGWAAGHWGVVLGTLDAGETWAMERDDTSVDQPLFTVGFTSPQDGYAAGLWSLLVATHDAGKTWQAMQLPKAPGKDGGGGGSGPNLFSLFSTAKGTLLLAGEQGLVYRSADSGKTWSAIETGGKGTLWAGLSLRSGALLVAGLGGKVYRSDDDGLTWKAVDSTTKSSITAVSQLSGGGIVAVGLDGVVLTSADDGMTFKATYQPERTVLTAVIEGRKDQPVLFSVRGPQIDGAATR